MRKQKSNKEIAEMQMSFNNKMADAMSKPTPSTRLYYHKTDGGAEYLTDKFITCPNGHKEGIFEGATYIVRIDGDIRKDAELTIKEIN